MTTVGTESPITHELEAYRRELTAYCYRMLGSGSEAEDAVQETMVRAWRNADTLTARGALRAWAYRIATNVCLDMLGGAQRRARPMDLTSPVTADAKLGQPLVDATWVTPIADAKALPAGGDPAELASLRESVRLAFVAALQHLPPRQRAVLVLREVLRFQATEVAELLETSVASVNSALQRARATLDSLDLDASAISTVDEEQEELLERYVDAFVAYDMPRLLALMHEDVEFNMPPFDLWLRGPEEAGRWMLGTGAGCRGSRVVKTRANGSPAFAAYKPSLDTPDLWEGWAIMCLEVRDGLVTAIHNFLDPRLFAQWGLPEQLVPDDTEGVVFAQAARTS